ncbi:MAG: HD domain-containing protein [Caldilineaceae bacterium]|nr:HD domain-containing protein [Caldilineaceae bacterium]
MPSLLNLFRTANHLKSLPRTGWLFAGVSQPESLADHTCLVALYALFLADEVNADYAGQGLTEPLDVKRIVTLALLHDLAESVLTDLPRRSAQALGSHAKHQAEERILSDLLAGLPQGQTYVALWQEYDAGSTPEARLVKDVDKLEMVLQSLRYGERGHTNLQEFRRGHQWHFPASRTLFEEICVENGE